MKRLVLVALLSVVSGYCSDEGTFVTDGTLELRNEPTCNIFYSLLNENSVLKVNYGTLNLGHSDPGERQNISTPGIYKITDPSGFGGSVELFSGVITAPITWIIEKNPLTQSDKLQSLEERIATLIAYAAEASANLKIALTFTTNWVPLAETSPEPKSQSPLDDKLNALSAEIQTILILSKHNLYYFS
ncbi:MAG: hypothetical protein LBJ89_02895 [Holosporales bacterium]|jgi:hypothetical protein|nr:hypothetical protein [Holosporales bacterium]